MQQRLDENDRVVDELVLRVKGMEPSRLPSGDRISRCEEEIFDLRATLEQLQQTSHEQEASRGQLAGMGGGIARELQGLRAEVEAASKLGAKNQSAARKTDEQLCSVAGVQAQHAAQYASLEHRMHLAPGAAPPPAAREVVAAETEALVVKLLRPVRDWMEEVEATAKVSAPHRLEWACDLRRSQGCVVPVLA